MYVTLRNANQGYSEGRTIDLLDYVTGIGNGIT